MSMKVSVYSECHCYSKNISECQHKKKQMLFFWGGGGHPTGLLDPFHDSLGQRGGENHGGTSFDLGSFQ